MRTEIKTINFYRSTLDAVKFINASDLHPTDKLCKIDHLLGKSVAEVNNTILIVDELGILD